jgi:hypothetical protein
MALAVSDKLIRSMVQNDPALLAPKFRAALEAAVARTNARGVDAVIYETLRSDALAQLYFRTGASKAPDGRSTWHFYGLASDLISKSRGWDVYPTGVNETGQLVGGDPEWYKVLWEECERDGLLAGGHNWPGFKDWSHWQWKACKVSPSILSKTLYESKGIEAVWAAVGAS